MNYAFTKFFYIDIRERIKISSALSACLWVLSAASNAVATPAENDGIGENLAISASIQVADFTAEHASKIQKAGLDLALNRLEPSTNPTTQYAHEDFKWRPASENFVATIQNEGLLWFSISLTNEIDSEQEVLIEFSNFDGAGWLDQSNSSDAKFIQSDYSKYLGGRIIFDRYFVLPVTLRANETKKVHGFVYSTYTPRAGRFNFWNPETFREARSIEFFVNGAYYGFILTLFFYNLALFFTMRQKSYLYGGVFLLSVGSVVFFISNYATILLLPSKLNLIIPLIGLSMLVAMVSSALFSISILRLQQTHPKLHKVWLGNALWSALQLPAVFLAVPSGYEVDSNQFMVNINAVMFIFIQGVHLYTLFYFWKRSSIVKYWFMVVTLQVWMLVAIPISHSIGYLDSTNFHYALQFFSIVNGVILTALISYTVRKEQRLRFQSQSNALENSLIVNDIQKSKANFINTAGHDLRQPLGAMRHHIEELKLSVSDEGSHVLAKIEANSVEINSLLSSLMNLSVSNADFDSADYETFKLSDVLDNLKDEIMPFSIQKGLDVSFPETFLSLHTSRVGLTQMLRNLLTNSVRFTEFGGISIHLIEAGDIAMIQVTDTGCGMQEKELTQIFSEFYQVEKKQSLGDSGMGLGLSIVDRISRALAIPIKVKSTVGQGTCFELAVKIAEDYEESSSTTQRATTLDGLNIEIIGTDSISNSKLVDLLREWGASPAAYCDLESILPNLKERSWPLDMLILSDDIYRQLTSKTQFRKIPTEDFSPTQRLLDRTDFLNLPILILYEPTTSLHSPTAADQNSDKTEPVSPLHHWFEVPISPGTLRSFIQRIVVNAN